jgi:hypothetical protein
VDKNHYRLGGVGLVSTVLLRLGLQAFFLEPHRQERATGLETAGEDDAAWPQRHAEGGQ